MPENLSQDQQALDWLTTANLNDQRAITAKQKLGVDDNDIKAYSWTKENADDPKAVIAKNKIFDKIANSVPSENVQGVKINERLAIKNLISNEPAVQVEYLRRKGYDTRVIDGEVEAKHPGDINFKKIDPTGFDLWDATDILSDIGQAVVTTLAGGAAGVAALPVAGPLGSVAAGTVAAGGAGMFYEVMKQDVANMAGVREGYSGDTMPLAFIEGAGGELGGRLISGAFKGVATGSKWMRRKFGVAVKETAPAIEAAAKEIGATPTSGMLVDAKGVKAAEDWLYKRDFTLGGMGLRKQIEGNKKAITTAAKTIIEDASLATPYEVGQKIGQQLIEEVSKKIQPAIDVYEKYDKNFKLLKPKKIEIEAIFDSAREKFLADPDAVSIIETMRKQSNGEGTGFVVKNIADLKTLRTAIGEKMRSANFGHVKSALSDLYSQITDLRKDTILKYAKGQNEEFFNTVAKDLSSADTIYAKGMQDAARIMGKGPGDKLLAPLKSLENFIGKTNPQELVKKVLKTGNPDQVKFLKDNYPQVFDEMRKGYLGEILTKSTKDLAVDPASLISNLKGLPKESRAMLLGDGANEKYEALKVFLDAFPKNFNTSNTAAASDLGKVVTNLVYQMGTVSVDAFRKVVTSGMTKPDIFAKLSKFAEGTAPKAAFLFGVEQRTDTPKLYLPGQTQPSFNQPVFMPRAK